MGCCFASSSQVLSSEIHGVLGVVVDLHGLGQRLRIAAVALPRHVAALSAVSRHTPMNNWDKWHSSASLPAYQEDEAISYLS